MKLKSLRHIICCLLVLMALICSGCAVTKEIVDLQTPTDQPRLEKLEDHLTYQDPDAGKPTYRRDD